MQRGSPERFDFLCHLDDFNAVALAIISADTRELSLRNDHDKLFQNKGGSAKEFSAHGRGQGIVPTILLPFLWSHTNRASSCPPCACRRASRRRVGKNHNSCIKKQNSLKTNHNSCGTQPLLHGHDTLEVLVVHIAPLQVG